MGYCKNLALKYAILGILPVLLFSGCGTKRFLNDDDYLLRSNDVVFTQPVKNSRDLGYDLSTFYKQRPNSNFLLFFPREWLAFKVADAKKPTAFNAWLYKTLGETPAIYNDSLSSQTAANMATYLHYQGYLRAKVLPQRSVRGKGIKVRYYVTPGQRFVVDSVSYSSADHQMDSLLQTLADESHFSAGEPLDLNNYQKDKQRITLALRNEGYANFQANFFDNMELDTFQHPGHANVYMSILKPYDEGSYEQYYIGNIDVFLDFRSVNDTIVADSTIGGLHFLMRESGFYVDSRVLREAISLRPGEAYSQENYDKTTDQLSGLGIFRFVRVKYVPDSVYTNNLNFQILLTPHKKLSLSAALDLDYTNRTNTLVGNLVGLSLSPGLRNRNLLRGAEQFSATFTAGLEAAPSKIGTSSFWNTVDIQAEFDLQLPEFIDYLYLWKTANRLSLSKERQFDLRPFLLNMRKYAHTRMAASYNYLLIFDWYSYNLLNLSYGYDVNISRFKRYLVDHFAINYLVPETQPLFELQLKQNPFLERSFGQQLFVSLLFRELDYESSRQADRRGRSGYFNFNFEVAGAEMYGINKLYNSLSGKDNEFRVRDSVPFSQYVTAEVNWHYNRKLRGEQALAARFNLGVARPFGFTTDVPYVKQFFVGGGNSMRAWAARGLGPGGYNDPLSLDPDNINRLFQTGDFKLEMNLEYRFPLLLYLKGALFLDAGNIWTLELDESRLGSQFLFKQRAHSDGTILYPFYKQMAVAGGMGFRLDVSYFVFRFDIGMKLRYNYPQYDGVNLPESAWWNTFRDIGRDDFGYQLGLGFPF